MIYATPLLPLPRPSTYQIIPPVGEAQVMTRKKKEEGGNRSGVQGYKKRITSFPIHATLGTPASTIYINF